MKNILVLGAGMVAGPLVRYLLEQPENKVLVGSRTVEKAQKMVQGYANGSALKILIDDEDVVSKAVADADIVISLLPWIHHLKVAKLCLKHGKHMVTTSYVKPEMKALDADVKAKGLLFLNEIGVDPGIDHMAAMKIIDHIHANGGTVESFYSYCGGLPALASNTNPFGYKFSWSPDGVLLAAGNDGRYLKNGKVVEIPGEKLFEHYWLLDVPGAGVFEAYVNRDALPYMDIYGIPKVKSMYRGTLRNISHCEAWNYYKKIGMLNQKDVFDTGKMPPKAIIAAMIGSKGTDIEAELASFLGIPGYSVAIKKLGWLGVLDDAPLNIGEVTPFALFAHLMKKRLVYTKGETDLLVQQHEFIAVYPDRKEEVISTLVNTGIPNGDSSMSRTVGLPAAIATDMLAKGKIDLAGVHIPVLSKVYTPVLEVLEKNGIYFEERVKTL